MTTADDDFKQEVRARLEARDGKSIDPSANVLALVAAGLQRQDDLRKSESKWRNSLSRHERRHRLEVRDLETKYRDAQLVAEARRLDALRASDKSDVALANTRAEGTATALAERVESTQKALATSVEATAKAFQTAVDATADAFAKRIAPLEQARYEQAGGKEQRTEGRAQSQWTIERVITLGIAALGALYFVIQQAQR